MPADHDTPHRRQGIDFGSLEEALETYDYPASTAAVVEAFGEYELVVADGTRTLADVLSPLVERAGDDAHTGAVELRSPDDVRQAVISAVDDGAIGRKGYSDRTPPAPGERSDGDTESI